MNNFTLFLLMVGFCLIAPFPIYALLLQLFPARTLHVSQKPELPGISVIVVVKDGAELIEQKLHNLLQLSYPQDLLEIIVYTDGCTDNTAQLARGFGERVKVIEHPQNLGKIQGMNQAVTEASMPILVFSDTDAFLSTDGLRQLAAYFSDNRIGGVCARRVIGEKGNNLTRAQDDYLGFDHRIKVRENLLGSITSNDGKLYAMRRDLYRPIPPAVTDDLYAALVVVRSGHRFIYAPDVSVTVAIPSRSLEHEVERRRRIVSTSLRGIWLSREVLNPFHYGAYSFALLANKVMRRMMPIGLFPFALAALLGWPLLTLVLLLVIASLLQVRPCMRESWVQRQTDRISYLLAGLYGTVLGVVDLLDGRAPAKWQPQKQKTSKGNPERPLIAYTMSRFPKLTETFVLYEILAVEKAGLEIAIFPMILLRENAEHPEIRELMPKVHFSPFLNLEVVRANLCWLLGSPVRYLGAWIDALVSAWPNRNYLIGALGVLPKSALYARQMKQMGIEHLHAHFATHPTLAARFIHKLSDIPYSFTAHGHDLHISTQGFDAKARDARFWVTISQYNLDLMADTFSPSILNNAHLVHCGVDTSRIHPAPPRPRDGVLRILCVAWFKEVKGHVYLIDACRRLLEKGVRFHCQLIGDGPIRREVEQQIETAGLLQHFTLSGQQPQPVVLEAMSNSDVVVLPSILASRGDREGIPVCLMEAMALERPVISSNLSGIPELVTTGREGILVEQKDSLALAEALEKLATDPQLGISMGKNGRKKVLSEFDLSNNVDQLASLLHRSVGNSRRAIERDQ